MMKETPFSSSSKAASMMRPKRTVISKTKSHHHHDTSDCQRRRMLWLGLLLLTALPRYEDNNLLLPQGVQGFQMPTSITVKTTTSLVLSGTSSWVTTDPNIFVFHDLDEVRKQQRHLQERKKQKQREQQQQQEQEKIDADPHLQDASSSSSSFVTSSGLTSKDLVIRAWKIPSSSTSTTTSTATESSSTATTTIAGDTAKPATASVAAATRRSAPAPSSTTRTNIFGFESIPLHNNHKVVAAATTATTSPTASVDASTATRATSSQEKVIQPSPALTTVATATKPAATTQSTAATTTATPKATTSVASHAGGTAAVLVRPEAAEIKSKPVQAEAATVEQEQKKEEPKVVFHASSATATTTTQSTTTTTSTQSSHTATDNTQKQQHQRKRRSSSSDNKQHQQPKKEDGRTLYEILGAPCTATRAELKACYVALARQTHPDALVQRAAARQQVGASVPTMTVPTDVEFTQVAAAWRTLSDPKERKRYDRSLRAAQFSENVVAFASEVLVPAAAFSVTMLGNVAASLHDAAAAAAASQSSHVMMDEGTGAAGAAAAAAAAMASHKKTVSGKEHPWGMGRFSVSSALTNQHQSTAATQASKQRAQGRVTAATAAVIQEVSHEMKDLVLGRNGLLFLVVMSLGQVAASLLLWLKDAFGPKEEQQPKRHSHACQRNLQSSVA